MFIGALLGLQLMRNRFKRHLNYIAQDYKIEEGLFIKARLQGYTNCKGLVGKGAG